MDIIANNILDIKIQDDISLLIDRRGYNNKWTEFTGVHWTIPHDHPGQNRKNCLNMTLKLNNGEIYKFYEDYKTIKRMFYLIHILFHFHHIF
jgi:hypothetical protein